jgi:hypothetical protein
MSEEIEFPTDLDFGAVFSQKMVTKTIEIYSPSRRSLNWKFYVESDFSDIFIVNSPTQGSIASKSKTTLTISFKPQIGVQYQSNAFFVVEDKVTSIELYGTGVEPTLNVQTNDTNFGTVGIADPEYREIVVHNPTPLTMRVRPLSDNPDFTPVETEVELAAGETRRIKVLFKPRNKNTVQVGKLTLYQLSEDSNGDDLTEVINVQWQGNPLISEGNRKKGGKDEAKMLDTIVFEGQGGDFGFSISGDSVVVVEKVTEELKLEEDNVKMSRIQMKFNRVAASKKVRKTFEVENSGDTILEFGTFDYQNHPIDDELEYESKNKCFKYSISPSNRRIMPQSKEKVIVVLEATNDGTDEFEFFVKTKNLLRNKVVLVQGSATVYTPTDMDNLRAFVRADDNLEQKYDLKAQEERYAMTDLHLWKVLVPIVRLSGTKPSEETQYIPPIEPSVARADIGPYVIRPPAIPEVHAPRVKKWYTNRISMAVDKLNRVDAFEPLKPTQERKEQMIEFLSRSKVEKIVKLDRKNK